MKHVMLDLETLSSSSKAAVIQIGAVVFDLEELHSVFKATIGVADAKKYGEVSNDTLDSAFSGTDSLAIALDKFTTFVNKVPGKPKFWAHATFDFPIIANAYRATGNKFCIPYRDMCDLRTLEFVAGDFIKWEKREGIHHDATDDAIFQAKHAQKMLRVVDTMQQRYGDK